MGEVNSQGVFTFEEKNISVLEAIAKAGGFQPSAVPSSTILIRGGFQNPKAMRLNLSLAIEKGDPKNNIAIMPGDVIFVPKKFIANANYFLNQILDPLSKGASTYDVYRNLH